MSFCLGACDEWMGLVLELDVKSATNRHRRRSNTAQCSRYWSRGSVDTTVGSESKTSVGYCGTQKVRGEHAQENLVSTANRTVGQGGPSKALSRGQEHADIPASQTGHSDGNIGTVLPRAMPSRGSLYSSSGSPRSRLSGRVSPPSLQHLASPDAQAKSLSAVTPPVLSTPAMAAATPFKVSLDGVLLFIGDTNIFPMLGFEVRGVKKLMTNPLE